MPRFLLAMLMVMISSAAAQVQRGATSATADGKATAIRATALDYIEGWYAGDAARMERALHPDLAKRMVRPASQNDAGYDPAKGASVFNHMGAMALVQGTRDGYGKSTSSAPRQKDVPILDVFGNAASVKIVAANWIDYLHLAKFNGRWVIVNVLWELKPIAP